VGRFFTSFDEAWRYFLARDEPLESFFAEFPDGESYILTWLLPFDKALVPRVRAVHESFAPLDWITPQPEHFLHTSVAAVAVSDRRPTNEEIRDAIEHARQAWAGVEPFEVEYRRVNCFHPAVVVEVAGRGPGALVSRLVQAGYWDGLPIDGAVGAVDPELFLAHVTIGLVNEPHDPSPLRDVLVQIRDAELGSQAIREAALCVVPASRTTILTPWDVVATVRFD
jgi:2'-5' RNA ligase